MAGLSSTSRVLKQVKNKGSKGNVLMLDGTYRKTSCCLPALVVPSCLVLDMFPTFFPKRVEPSGFGGDFLLSL